MNFISPVMLLKFICVKLFRPIFNFFEHQAEATYPLMKWYKSNPNKLCAITGILKMFSLTLKLQKSCLYL